MPAQTHIDLFDTLLGTQAHPIFPGWNIQLQAKNPRKNIFRRYGVRVDKNLLGEWCLYLNYGRIGSRGQSKLSFWSDLSQLYAKIKHILRKRLNATQRIGCNYQIVSYCNGT